MFSQWTSIMNFGLRNAWCDLLTDLRHWRCTCYRIDDRSGGCTLRYACGKIAIARHWSGWRWWWCISCFEHSLLKCNTKKTIVSSTKTQFQIVIWLLDLQLIWQSIADPLTCILQQRPVDFEWFLKLERIIFVTWLWCVRLQFCRFLYCLRPCRLDAVRFDQKWISNVAQWTL